MNKLELLYKMSRTMKDKENVEGTVKIVALDGEKEVANIKNNFKKDIVNKTMSIDVQALADFEDLKLNKSIKKDINFEELHAKHHGMHHGKGNDMNGKMACEKGHHMNHEMHRGHCCHGKKRGFNKFAKLEMMFKALNDMELKEEGNANILELDITEMLEKKKAKFAEHKAKFEGHGEHHHHHHNIEDCDLKEIFQIKHALFKEVMSTDYDKVMLKVKIDEEFSIKAVEVKATGNKALNVDIEIK